MSDRLGLCEVCRLRPRAGLGGLFCVVCQRSYDLEQRCGNLNTTAALILWTTRRAWRFARAKVRVAALRP